MKRTLMISLLGCTAAMLSGAYAQQDQTADTVRGVEERFVWVTPSRAIIGEDLVGERERAGTVKFLLIDVADGDLIYALTSVGQAGQFAAVPWEALNADDLDDWKDGELQLNIPAERVEDAWRFDIEDIFRLTSPVFAAEAADTYGVEIEAPAAEDTTMLVIGRELAGTVSPPATQVRNQIEGSSVVTSDGVEIGEITEIMVDMDQGKVPYVTISTGGFLGSDQSYLPVPPMALNWNAEGAQYSVERTAAEIEELPSLAGNTLTAFVSRSDLEQLYEFWGVDPYWTSP
ncbi:PRC-barrel domain-containing protein [Nitratireductor thuwali]|uniref:PRC-barrel domain-containing protein n=1 Tax=Nitratireductor thuwali TaxID=2267699 RepID=A0ABY5MLI4_9HYPH|nr:hypothetical protein NTH_02708 [Nitratireductor thuwali]